MAFPATLRQTQQRESIYKFLDESSLPLTPEAIHEQLKDKIDLSTVYRTLDVFHKAHVVHKLLLDNKIYYYLASEDHKHFLICLACHHISEIHSCPFHVFEHKIEKETDFHVTYHPVELYGYCKECKKLDKNHKTS